MRKAGIIEDNPNVKGKHRRQMDGNCFLKNVTPVASAIQIMEAVLQ
jgi:hypothetical protein